MVRGYTLRSQVGFSIAANAESANVISGATYDYIQAGTLTLFARGSATGLQFSCFVNAKLLVRNQDIPYFGTSGALSSSDHWCWSAGTLGGRVELYFRNTTAGALTVDYNLIFDGVPFGGIISQIARRNR